MDTLVWTNENGGVSFAILQKASDADLIIAAHVTDVADTFIIDDSLLPARCFRDAWRLDAQGNVAHDLNAAKAIAHEQRRAERDLALEPLDRQATYDLAGAEPLRQAVRDADAIKQAEIDACTTIEELEAVCQA